MFVKPPKLIQKIYPSLVWKIHTLKKEVWLTFDDGPDPEVTPWILQILKKHNIKATFFLIGKEIDKYPSIVEYIKKENHIVGNHSYSHINGWLYSTKTYIKDVNKCQELMPKNILFRPPYGKITPWQIRCLKNNYKLILWDILAYDFKKEIKAKDVKKNVLNNVNRGSIVTLHNNQKSWTTLQQTLEELIIQIENKGFSFSNTW
mgnify:CR=1 FL=1